ncbi:MAG TPA: lysozyme inhibitor LprI family protein [Methyloradius sp.]
MRLFLQCLFLWAIATSLAIADCNDDEGTTQSIVSKCLNPQLIEVNSSMTTEYENVLKAIEKDTISKDTSAATLLKKAQKSWFIYRDSFCEAKGISIVGGQTARAIPELECQIELTENRRYELLELNTFLSNRNSLNVSP